jgi:hypothetical protein
VEAKEILVATILTTLPVAIEFTFLSPERKAYKMKHYFFLALALLVSLQSSSAVKEKQRNLSDGERTVEEKSISEFGVFEDEDFFGDINRELHSSMSMPGGKGGKGKGTKPSSTPPPSPKSKSKSNPKPTSGKGDDDDDDDGKGKGDDDDDDNGKA